MFLDHMLRFVLQTDFKIKFILLICCQASAAFLLAGSVDTSLPACTGQHHITTFHCTIARIVEGDDWRKLQEQQTSWMMFVPVSSLLWADQEIWWKCWEKNWGAVTKTSPLGQCESQRAFKLSSCRNLYTITQKILLVLQTWNVEFINGEIYHRYVLLN